MRGLGADAEGSGRNWASLVPWEKAILQGNTSLRDEHWPSAEILFDSSNLTSELV